MQAPMAARVLALIVGLAILAGFWTLVTYVVWLFFACSGGSVEADRRSSLFWA